MDQLEAYIKAEKDKRNRINAHFLFADAALKTYERKECDHRVLMVVSLFYGKAVRMMDLELWDEYLE